MMAPPWSYDRLPSIHEPTPDQDITDANGVDHDTQVILSPLDAAIALRPLSYLGYQDHNQVDENDAADQSISRSFETSQSTTRLIDTDRSNMRSFDTGHSASRDYNLNKLKQLGARIRRKPLPRYLKGSVKRHPAAELEHSRVGRGLWKDQLMIDRSFRGMAACMCVLALAMVILVAVYAKTFKQRANRNTSSVGGETQPCEAVTKTTKAFLLLTNVCATITLGISNSYQTLSCALKVSDLKYVLSKFGDSRVGTNSPFCIKHKKEGRKRAWASWLFLITTSMPVHFLANSLVGPSRTQELPSQVDFVPETNMTSKSGARATALTVLDDSMSFACWSAFKTGLPHYPVSTKMLQEESGEIGAQSKFSWTWTRMEVHYSTGNCTQFLKTLSSSPADLDKLERSHAPPPQSWDDAYWEQSCKMGTDVYCSLYDPVPVKCRLSVRMSAALTLMACLVLKAVYMVGVNLVNRGQLKTHLLTFGDVIIASASNPELRVQGECMVNGGDSFRRAYSHTCHKHCFNTEETKTGDEIGHCQKCKKWNSHDRFANLPQPTITTKIKKSLLSNLGSTALTQMILLMFTSTVMLGASLALAIPTGIMIQSERSYCKLVESQGDGPWEDCLESDADRLERISGGFGGFGHSLALALLPPDSLAHEFISFSISNGAQFIYSLLYLMLIYNITLISQEYDWGKLEYSRKRIRSTIVSGPSFNQDYLLQLPKKIIFPIMAYSTLTHWMLGEALQTQELIWLENMGGRDVEHSRYVIMFAGYPLWAATILILVMTGVCWWAFTYRREGFIPQMYGSVRVLMAATTQLDDFPENGIQWGDLGHRGKFRHAGLSAEDVMNITPNDLYAGEEDNDWSEPEDTIKDKNG